MKPKNTTPIRQRQTNRASIGGLVLLGATFAVSPIQSALPETTGISVRSHAPRAERWHSMVTAMEQSNFEYAAEFACMSDATEFEKLDKLVDLLTQMLERPDSPEPSNPNESTSQVQPKTSAGMATLGTEPVPIKTETAQRPPNAPSNLTVTSSHHPIP